MRRPPRAATGIAAGLGCAALALALGCGRAAGETDDFDPASVHPAAASPDELSVVSYNVHGLPAWIAFDDPAARMPRIAPRLAPYDVAFVQEDWSYPGGLRDGAAPPIDLRAARAGLSLFARLPRESLLAEEAAPYGICAGWILGANDCFADKGAQRARLRLRDGALLDVWNTHLDAGLGDADQAARVAQLDLLAARIERESAGRAVVLGGDLNLDYDLPQHRAAVDAFRARVGLEDSGARPDHPTRGVGYAGRIDWVLYRSGDGIHLAPLEAGEAREFTRAGVPLSDHPAVYARFRVERAP